MAMHKSEPTNSSGTLAATSMVILSSVGFGHVPLFAKSLMHTGIASTAIIWYRFAISAVVLLPFVALSYPKRSATALALGSGLAMGLGSIGKLQALTPVERQAATSLGGLVGLLPLIEHVTAIYRPGKN
jgi:drug/metabolite transporter (DMT)-like permease